MVANGINRHCLHEICQQVDQNPYASSDGFLSVVVVAIVVGYYIELELSRKHLRDVIKSVVVSRHLKISEKTSLFKRK